MPNKNKNTEMPQCVQTDVTSRTFKCLKCKNYSVKALFSKLGKNNFKVFYKNNFMSRILDYLCKELKNQIR